MRILVWVDRQGNSTRLIEEENAFLHPRLSPDDSRVAVSARSPRGSEIWVYDHERGTRTRLTAGGWAADPAWARDGTHVLFSWMPDSAADFDIYTKRADGSGEAALVLSVPGHAYQPEPPPDGQALAYTLAPGNDVCIAPEEGCLRRSLLIGLPQTQEIMRDTAELSARYT